MNNQFFLCQQRDPQNKSFYGVNFNAIEAFWFFPKTENTEASMTIHFCNGNDSVEIQGADAERLLAMMNLRQPPEEKAQKADNSLDREFVRN